MCMPAAWLIWAASLQGVLVSSASPGRRTSEGSTAAVLSATGDGYLMKPATKTNRSRDQEICCDQRPPLLCCKAGDDAWNGNPADTLKTTAPCHNTCNEYKNGAGPGDLTTCMTNNVLGICDEQGLDCPDRCVQRVEPLCPYQCSAWVGESHFEANNVCLNVSYQLPTMRAALQPPPFQCTGGVSHAGSSISCPENKSLLNYTKCRQMKVNYCTFNCEKYLSVTPGPNFTAPTQDTKIVCQNLNDADPENYQACMPLPCSSAFHKAEGRGKVFGKGYETYTKSQVCKQTLLICPNICAKGPYPEPPSVCFDNSQWGTSGTFEHCTDPAENGDVCPGDTLRCIPTYKRKSEKKIDAPNSLLATGHKSSKHVHRTSVMRRDEADVAE